VQEVFSVQKKTGEPFAKGRAPWGIMVTKKNRVHIQKRVEGNKTSRGPARKKKLLWGKTGAKRGGGRKQKGNKDQGDEGWKRRIGL